MKQKKILFNHIVTYPTPYNISYFYSFGFLAGFMLMNQIVTGLILAMYYINSGDMAFDSIEFIMRNVNYGWFLRYLHSNGASFFFIVLYIHISKGLYYKSYMYPRHKVWYSGLIIYFLVMATAFLGYVLPWGQMSFWGATVITNLISVIPFVGDNIVEWIWCGYSVNAKTLQRFFVLHYLLPFVILGLVMIHIVLLHEVGSSNPLNFDKKNEKINFFPYFYFKDIFATIILLIFLILIVCFYSNLFNHADNYIKANSLATPHHIVPEWYFLPFYAILRAIANKTLGILLFLASLVVYFFLPLLHTDQIFFYNNFFNKKISVIKKIRANIYIIKYSDCIKFYIDFIGILINFGYPCILSNSKNIIIKKIILYIFINQDILNIKLNHYYNVLLNFYINLKYKYNIFSFDFIILKIKYNIIKIFIYLNLKASNKNFNKFLNQVTREYDYLYLKISHKIEMRYINIIHFSFFANLIQNLFFFIFENVIDFIEKFKYIQFLINYIYYPLLNVIIVFAHILYAFVDSIVTSICFVINFIKNNIIIDYLIYQIKLFELLYNKIKDWFIIFIDIYKGLKIQYNLVSDEEFNNYFYITNTLVYNKMNKNLYNIWFYNNNLYYKQLFWMLVVVFISLGYVGQMEVNTVSIELGQDLTLLYFLIIFLFSFPYLSSIIFVYILFIIMFILGVFFKGFFGNLESIEEIKIYDEPEDLYFQLFYVQP